MLGLNVLTRVQGSQSACLTETWFSDLDPDLQLTGFTLMRCDRSGEATRKTKGGGGGGGGGGEGLSLSRIDCCKSLLAGLPLSLISKLQRVQNCAARLIVRASPNVHTTPILAQLHWLPVQARISYKIACFRFSSINSSASAYLSDILHVYSLLDHFVPVLTPVS